MNEYKNYPFHTIGNRMAELVEQGIEVNQKFTCAKCGSRQTMAEANVMFRTGRCEECDHITDIEKSGCNIVAQGNFDTVMKAFSK